MRIRKYTLFILVLFIFGINDIKAEECDNNHILQLKELAENIDYEYKYIGNEENYQLYELNFYGVDDQFYIKYSGMTYLDDYSFERIESGTKEFDIYSKKCFEEKIKTITVVLPVFNTYSVLEVCKDIGDKLDVCDEWYRGSINLEQFEQAIDNYNEKNSTNKSNFINLFSNYYYYFIIGLIVLILLVTLFIIYRKKKNTLE